MRIARFVTAFPARPELGGGITPNIYHLSTQEIDAGHETAIFTFDDGPIGRSEVDGIPVYRIRKPPTTRILLGRELLSTIRSNHFEPDIVHSMNAMPLGWLFRESNSMNARFVLSIHTPVFLRELPSLSVSYLQKREYELLLARLAKKVDLNIAVSRFVRRQLVAIGVPRERIRVIPSGTDVAFFRSRSTAKDRGAKEGYEILYVGRIAKIKGLVYLIRAMDIVRRWGYSEIKLKLLGGQPEDDDYARVSKSIDALSLRQQITIQPPVPYWRTPRHYGSADCLVLPSVNEPLGKVTLEAMASGIPVLASNSGGIPDVVRDRKNGLLFESGNPMAIARSIVELVEDRALTARLVRNGLSFAEYYDWEVISSMYLKVFEDALNG